MGSTLKEKNLLLEEQIFSLRVDLITRETKIPVHLKYHLLELNNLSKLKEWFQQILQL